MKQEIPYIWFGGKRRVANIIWQRLGNVDNYIEPFFGGGAVFLLRPHEPKLETINDMDAMVSNFWRAVQREPESVAELMNYPVNEVDLEARHIWLCTQPDKDDFVQRMKQEPEYYDIKRAAWWCWGLNMWIGSGWCQGEYYPENQKTNTHKKRPHLNGMVTHTNRLSSTTDNTGQHEKHGNNLRAWMFSLRDRLRRTRVCCGDWSRVCTSGATCYGKTVGVFLDPPYSDKANRCENIYTVDSLSVAHEVREWCKEFGDNKRYRIALCGYDIEHEELEKLGWTTHKWQAQGGMANIAKAELTQGKANKKREVIWFSPHCISDEEQCLNLTTEPNIDIFTQ